MNYFNIQKNRFGDKISCEILYHDVEKELVEKCYIPKLILQPTVGCQLASIATHRKLLNL